MTLIKMKEYLYEISAGPVATTMYLNDGGSGGGGSSSNTDPNGYTIGVNSEVMSDLIDDFNNQTSGQIVKIKNALDSIYNKIDTGFVDCWTGAGYNEFKASCDAYKDSVYQIVTFMENYVKILQNVQSESSTLMSSVNDAFETSGGGGGR